MQKLIMDMWEIVCSSTLNNKVSNKTTEIVTKPLHMQSNITCDSFTEGEIT